MKDRKSNRVLIIDDSAAARASMSSLLRDAGYEVFELPSAIGATRTILRNEVGVAIVDLGMPGLPGDKLIALLRQNDRMRHLKIIVVSGQGDVELQSIKRECRVDATLKKGEISRRLVRLVDACFQPATPAHDEHSPASVGHSE